MRHLKTLMGAAAGLALAGCATAPVDTASCDRVCALEAARLAMSGPAVDLTGLTITENGAPVALADRTLAQVSDVVMFGEYADDDGQAVIVGTATGADGKPLVFGLSVDAPGGVPASAEVLIARDGEASLFPPEVPIKRDPLFDAFVPDDQRTAPETMIALAETYFDGIENSDGSKLAVTDDCERVENGVQTTHSPRFSNLDCNSLWPFQYITTVRDRSYPVVDVARGVVVGIVTFDIPGGTYEFVRDDRTYTRDYQPRSLYLMEAFKVVDGKVRQIEATMLNVPLGAKMSPG